MDRRDFLKKSMAAIAAAAVTSVAGSEAAKKITYIKEKPKGDGNGNHNPGKLGFGLMRLPQKYGEIDIEQTSRMVDLFLASGFTYFDTAYVYTGSEEAARKALVERHPRESFTLATKLYANQAHSEADAKRQYEVSLQRTGAGYFDYYLLHSLMNGNYKKYDRFNLWEFVKEEKAKGRIRHYGFSYHAGPELLDELLTEHDDIDFVQLQINYADWENGSIQSRANYEVARKHNKQIVIMEPIKGGRLANPPKKVKEIFKAVNPDMSYASWAIRFCASLDGVLSVLSGMSNYEQMLDNVSYMKDFQPLNDEEMAAIIKARAEFGASSEIPCTTCKYCMKGCPKKINIPGIFTIMNKRTNTGLLEQASADYKKLVGTGNGAADCIKCGQCEQACPQHIKVISELEKCAKAL